MLCSTLVQHFDVYVYHKKMNSSIYLKFLIGVLTELCQYM